MARRDPRPSGNPDGRRPAEGSDPGLRCAPSPRAGRGTFVQWLIRSNDSLLGDAIGLACLIGTFVLLLYAAPILEEIMR